MLPLPLFTDTVFRMLCAVLVGCLIGVDRDLHGKPTGMKTLRLVSLGACIATMCAMNFSAVTLNASTDVSRVVQGIVTGIGFLGAGVILKHPGKRRIRGLTTAASIWVTAAVGILCSMGVWGLPLAATILLILLLLIGRTVEKYLLRRWERKTEEERARSADVEDQ